MATAHALRREMSPESPRDREDEIALLDGIANGIARLSAADDPIFRGFSEFLSEARGLSEFMAGIANQQGHSFGDELRTAQRYAAFRELGKTMVAGALRARLSAYQANGWLRDRGKPNPYSAPDPKFYFFEILKLRDHVPSERWIREILKSKGV